MNAKSHGIFEYTTTHDKIEPHADAKTKKHYFELSLMISSSVGPELKYLVNLNMTDEACTFPLQCYDALKPNSNHQTIHPDTN